MEAQVFDAQLVASAWKDRADSPARKREYSAFALLARSPPYDVKGGAKKRKLLIVTVLLRGVLKISDEPRLCQSKHFPQASIAV